MIFNVSGGGVPSSRIVNNFDTTEAGFIADARALKTLNDRKLEMELLWQNASPTSVFASQNISLDLTKFRLIIVDFVFATTTQAYSLCGIGFKNRIALMSMANGSDNTNIHRQLTINDDGVTISNIYYNGTEGGSYNMYMIPKCIYGVWGGNYEIRTELIK